MWSCFQFIAATDKLYFWIDIYSIVDHFTIGPTFYGVVVDTNWIGKPNSLVNIKL